MKINKFAIINDKDGEIKGKVINFDEGLNIIKSDSTHGKSYIFALLGATLGSYRMALVAQKEIAEGGDGVVKTILDMSWGDDTYIIKMNISAKHKSYYVNGILLSINELIEKIYSKHLTFPLVNFWSKAASTVEPGDFLSSIMDTQSAAQSANIYDGIVGESAVRTRYIFGVNSWRGDFENKVSEINDNIENLKEAVNTEVINDFVKLQNSMKNGSKEKQPSMRVVKLMNKRENLSRDLFIKRKTLAYKKKMNQGFVDPEILESINSYNKKSFTSDEINSFRKILLSIFADEIISNEDTSKLEDSIIKMENNIKNIDKDLKKLNDTDTYVLELLGMVKTDKKDPERIKKVSQVRELIGDLYATGKKDFHNYINSNSLTYYEKLSELNMNLEFSGDLVSKYKTIGTSGVKKVTSNLVARFLGFEYLAKKQADLFIVDSLLETSASERNVDQEINIDIKQKYSNIFLAKAQNIGKQFIIFLDTKSVSTEWEEFVRADLTLISDGIGKAEKILEQNISNDIDKSWIAGILANG